MIFDLQNVTDASPESLLRYIRERIEDIQRRRRPLERIPPVDLIDWMVLARVVELLCEQERRP